VKRSIFGASEIREALGRLPDVAAQESLNPPPLASVYVPLGHQKALSLDASVVVGMRGAGKSLWTAVLNSDQHRQFVAGLANTSVLGKATVRVGFGLDESSTHFPSSAVLAQLVEHGVGAVPLWKWVVVRHALEVAGLEQLQKVGPQATGADDWFAMPQWSASNPQQIDELLTKCDSVLAAKGKVLLVVFDALDRLSEDWGIVRSLIAGALRFALACRARRAIRLKFFLRPDMEEDAGIWKFPDSSKLQHAKVELEWRTADLYALIMTFLGNDVVGASFRRQVGKVTGIPWQPRDGVYSVPRGLIRDEKQLREIVEEIAGAWMGKSHKRGFTYTWVPTHLADAVGRVSPRSFLLTFKRAAAATEELHGDHLYPLHYEAIQQGVAGASAIRIGEIKEDYPWVQPLLEAARGLSVPCEPEELLERWTKKEIDEVRAATKLPPRRFTTDPNRSGTKEVLIDDLVELAVLYRTEDGRLNMPDIFRVGFGIKRKGGVKPPK
jgi:hypothetical protein